MERSEKGVDLVGGVSTQFKMGKLLENECMEEGEWKCWKCQHNAVNREKFV